MPRNRLTRIIKNYRPKGRRNQGQCESGTGQEAVQLHVSLMMMMMVVVVVMMVTVIR